jgi:hypothetical protein
MGNDPYQLDHYLIRRRIMKVLGASFDVLDGDEPVAFTSQKAFKLKEDIRVFTRDDMSEQILSIKARSMIDFAAAYDIVDSRTNETVGTARRRGFQSFVRDAWDVLDAQERPVAHVIEDSAVKAMVRRMLTNVIPQTFHLKIDGAEDVTLKQHWNPFVYRLGVSIPNGCPLDRRLILSTAILIAAIEGRQN